MRAIVGFSTLSCLPPVSVKKSRFARDEPAGGDRSKDNERRKAVRERERVGQPLRQIVACGPSRRTGGTPPPWR